MLSAAPSGRFYEAKCCHFWQIVAVSYRVFSTGMRSPTRVYLKAATFKALAAKQNQALHETFRDCDVTWRQGRRMLRHEVSPSPRTRRKMCAVLSCTFDNLFEIAQDGRVTA